MNIQSVEKTSEAPALAVESPPRASGRQPSDADTKSGGTGSGKPGGNPELTSPEKEKLLGEVRDYFQAKGVNLHFKMLDSLKEVQVEVVDQQTSKVIRKIPEDELVRLAQSMKKMSKGVVDVAI